MLSPIFFKKFNGILFLAPGSYDVEKSEKIIHHSSGAITFGIKYKEQKPDDIPGNNWFIMYGIILYVKKFIKSSLERIRNFQDYRREKRLKHFRTE